MDPLTAALAGFLFKILGIALPIAGVYLAAIPGGKNVIAWFGTENETKKGEIGERLMRIGAGVLVLLGSLLWLPPLKQALGIPA